MRPLAYWTSSTWLGRLLLTVPVVQALSLVLLPSPAGRKVVSDLGQLVSAVAAAVALTGAAVKLRRERSDTALGWGVVAVAAWLFATGAIGFTYLEAVRGIPPYPGFPDVFYLAFYPAMLAGLMLLPTEPASRREWWNNALDMGAFALVAAMVIWHVNLRHLLHALSLRPDVGVRLSLCYTVLDALLLMSLLFRLVRKLGTGRLFVPMLLLVVGGFFLIAADLFQGYIVTVTQFASGTAVDLGWTIFSSLAGLAGVYMLARGDGTTEDITGAATMDSVRTFWTIAITYVWIGMVVAMLVWAVATRADVHVVLLAAGVVGGTLLAVTRQVRTLQEASRLYNELQEAHDHLEVAVRERTAELRDSEQRCRAIFNSAYELIGLLSPDGTLLEINETAIRMVGVRREDVIGRPFWETPWWNYAPEVQDRVRAAIARAAKGQLYRGHELHPTCDGGRAVVEYTLKPVFDDAGKVVLVIPEGHDVTERVAAEAERDRLLLQEQEARKQAEVANAAKDRFIAVLSHELRTPLTPVLMTLNVWRNNGVVDPSYKDDLEMLIRNVQLEARLIDDLLDTTRVARGKMHLARSTCDLQELVRETAEMFYGDEGAPIVLELSPGRIVCEADPVRIRQVVWNFLSNARKFTPADGLITVRTGTRDGEAWVSVTDTGVGIAAEQIAGLFNAFVQGTGHEVRPQGLGLGLAISRAIARAHGGEVTCASEGVGKGAEFVLHVPVSRQPGPVKEPPAKPKEGAPAEPRRGDGRSILLVEDHPDTARVLSRLLAASGYEVRKAHSLAEARGVLAEWTPDLMVSDLGLPDGSGHELMREMRDRGTSVRGIAVSGYGTAEDIQHSEEAGFARHLTKPVTPAMLLATIGEMFEGAAATGK